MRNGMQCRVVLRSNKQLAPILVILTLFYRSKLYATWVVRHFSAMMKNVRMLYEGKTTVEIA